MKELQISADMLFKLCPFCFRGPFVENILLPSDNELVDSIETLLDSQWLVHAQLSPKEQGHLVRAVFSSLDKAKSYLEVWIIMHR